MHFWSAILKRYTKPLTKPACAVDWTRLSRHRFENVRFHPSPRKHENGVFENLRFHPPTRKHENGVFENLHSGERFRKPSFSHAENAVYVWTQRQNGEKNLRF